MDPKLVKLFIVVILGGLIGMALAFLPILFRKTDGSSQYGTTAGVGFLVGASLGGLYGIFAVLLNKI